MSNNLLELKGIKKYFPIDNGMFAKNKKWLKAVDGISLKVEKGETVGLVGESGCGKSTLGRLIAGLSKPTNGNVYYQGQELLNINKKQLGKEIQMVFQDPYSSLNPRMRVDRIIGEPLHIHKIGTNEYKKKRIAELLEKVGLSNEHSKRYPAEFSGGQRQRIGIARALALNPKLIICDEPVSALDVSIQAQILNLLKEIQNDTGISYIFIAHGLQAVKYISDRVVVMYLGKVMEISKTQDLFDHPFHPYTKALISAVPEPNPKVRDRERIILNGDLPRPENPPIGCRFCTRCPNVEDKCRELNPPLHEIEPDRWVACFYPV
ncbi:ATP-binding cassette domain-containing protein [Cytobacillus kochii]|uniref:ABC transporter ATP-binding protein n=1 Tax=Cytobacillus kochii TaxID=859143 RepID=UPI001CD7035B|nr:oligopeptide/dipeptide ABC transporter ATP-binding protein [Cytobacillus kochii]MCA1026659.1 ATP-binding cassette domain-containing protein [Cytobacillus kochii]